MLQHGNFVEDESFRWYFGCILLKSVNPDMLSFVPFPSFLTSIPFQSVTLFVCPYSFSFV